jgi:hypothetical protein
MATPADQRLLELLDKWLKSLQLHAEYSSLDDDSYWKIQPWVEHQRPSRWIIDLAIQKTLALRSHVEERMKAGDAQFSDSLELMTFLANLVGSEHIERFIPVAAAENERRLAPEPPEPPKPPEPTGTSARGHESGGAFRTQVIRGREAGSQAREQAAGANRHRAESRAKIRPRHADGCRTRPGHRRRRPVGSVGTKVVRVAGTHRTHGGQAVAARGSAYTERGQSGHR